MMEPLTILWTTGRWGRSLGRRTLPSCPYRGLARAFAVTGP
jgi:hypothetical protein